MGKLMLNGVNYSSKISKLEELEDININTPSNGQVLKYNSTNQKWENANAGGGGGASALDDLTDVNVSNPTAGQVLTYDDINEEWKNANPSGGASDLEDLGDVNLTSPSNGQVLSYDSMSQKWINTTPSGGGGGGTLSITRTTLSTELMNATNHDYTLSDAYTNYDFIEFWTVGAGYQNSEGELKLICVSDLKDFMDTGRTFTMSGYSNRYFNFKLTNTTTIRASGIQSFNIFKVVGIKFTLS